MSTGVYSCTHVVAVAKPQRATEPQRAIESHRELQKSQTKPESQRKPQTATERDERDGRTERKTDRQTDRQRDTSDSHRTPIPHLFAGLEDEYVQVADLR